MKWSSAAPLNSLVLTNLQEAGSRLLTIGLSGGMSRVMPGLPTLPITRFSSWSFGDSHGSHVSWMGGELSQHRDKENNSKGSSSMREWARTFIET